MMQRLLIVVLLLTSQVARAKKYTVEDRSGSPVQNIDEMKPGVVYYELKKPAPFGPDISSSALNLYPGYDEPLLHPEQGRFADPKERAHLTVVMVKVSALLDRPVDSVDLGRYKVVQNLAQLDPDVTQTALNPAEVVKFTKPLQIGGPPPPVEWCAPSRSGLCLKSSNPVPFLAEPFVLEHCGATSLEGESEVRILSAGDLASDPAQAALLQKLSILPATSPASTLEQNIFHFNCHEVRYGKTVALIQPVPGEAKSSLFTGYLVFAFETRAWEGKGKIGVLVKIKDVALGVSSYNRLGTGLVKGIPYYSQEIATKIAEDLSP